MRPGAILREAVENLRCGATRGVILAAVLCSVIIVSGLFEIMTVTDLRTRADRFRGSGGSTVIYEQRGAIDGAACDALATVPGVIAAGALRQNADGRIASQLPGQRIPTFDISPGFGGFTPLAGARGGDGVLISDDVGRTLGVRPGGQLDLLGVKLRVSGVFAYPADGRRPGYGYGIFTPTDVRRSFDECWIESWPADAKLSSLLPTVLRPGSVGSTPDQRPRLSQLNASLGASFTGETLFRERVSRWGAYGVAAVAFIIGAAGVWWRRLELASARHAGVRGFDLMAQLTVETAIWMLGAAALATSVLVASSVSLGLDDTSMLTGLVVPLLAAAPLAVVGACSALLCVREKALVTYFRSR